MSEELTFGSWLRQRRKELSVTQEELADRLGISWITLRKLEAGERHPSGQVALLLADYFRLPSDERQAFVAFARTGRQVSSGEASSTAPWRTALVRQTNLPAILTQLIGRDGEVEAALDHLLNPKTRLLTLIGAPGIGKTRLALQVAFDLLANFEDGVYFVDLAPVMDPELVLPAIARTLGLKETAQQPIENLLLDYLRQRRVLLLLDNFEQVLDASTEVVKLMEASPWLKVLITSREALQVRGERRFFVPPLAVPPVDDGRRVTDDGSKIVHRPSMSGTRTIVQLLGYPSVELFVDRAQAVAPDFSLLEPNAQDVAALCVGLEGLPLAIEIAASRANQLSPADMRVGLTSRLKLLKAETRDLPGRQRTLLNAIQWSYDLLSKEEQGLFAMLGVFAGGCTLHAIEAVSGAGRDARKAESMTSQHTGGERARRASYSPLGDAVTSLTNKSLLRQVPRAGGVVRLTMLETLREYAAERLAQNGQEELTRKEHASFFADLAEEGASHHEAPDESEWWDRLEAEHDNIRAALGWLLEYGRGNGELTELALKLGAGLYGFWNGRGHFTEGREWLGRVIHNARLLPPQAESELFKKRLAKVLNDAGLLAWNQGDSASARRLYEEALTLRREVGDKRGECAAYNNLAILAMEQEEYVIARELNEQCLALAEEIGNLSGAAMVFNNLGVVYWQMGEIDTARDYYEQGLARFRDLGEKSNIIMALENLGMVATRQRDFSTARRYQQEGLAMCRQLGDTNNLAHVLVSSGLTAVEEEDYIEASRFFTESLPLLLQLGYKRLMAKCFEGIAAMCLGSGRPVEAARLWGAAAAIREALGTSLPVHARARHGERVAAARSQAGPAPFEAAWAEGHAMSLEQAVDYALEDA